jgi:tRNA wybutosine-synthesizing protein 1
MVIRMSLPEEFRNNYRKQKYSLIGKHSALKTCHWQRRSLNTNGKENCYKNKFYGIPTHRCLQITPSLGHCTQSCFFCWRTTPETLKISWNQTQILELDDEPEKIVNDGINSYKKLLSGFGGNPNVSTNVFNEAKNPIHAAISLEGEPTLYPRLGELIKAFYNEKFKSVFLVTNGTQPKILSELDVEPTQLYISLCAPNKETYERTCRPMIPDAWEKLLDSLELVESFNCPTVLRNTLIPKINMHSPESYAKLVSMTNATYIESKAAMSVGAARSRFSYKEMAWHKDIQSFANALAEASSYQVIDEQRSSSIVLLSRLKRTIKLY